MTQICIQLEDSLFDALETTAAKNNTSVSQWIKDRIHHELKPRWPDNYFSVFGALDEDDLAEPGEIPLMHDPKREEL